MKTKLEIYYQFNMNSSKIGWSHTMIILLLSSICNVFYTNALHYDKRITIIIKVDSKT